MLVGLSGCVNEVCMDGCVGMGWVCVWGVGGWMSEFWTSPIVAL